MDKSRVAHNLITDAGIEKWISDHAPDGFVKLQSALNTGLIVGARARFVADFIARKQAIAGLLAEAERTARDDRTVAAAERSSRWAGLAVLLSLAALVVSAWPLVKEYL